MHRQLTALSLAAAAILTLAAAARAEGAPPEKKVERIVIAHGGHPGAAMTLPDPSQIPGDHLKITDLASLVPGESRVYTTDEGKEVTFTRREGEGERYTLATGGKEIEIGSDLALLGGNGEGKRIVVRHEVKKGPDGAEEVEEEQTIGGPAADLLLNADGPPPLVIEIVGEKDGKVTRQVIVLRTREETAGS